ncbi:NUDIX hydrolase [Lentibacter sp. XHP0401]|jgi:8-oxo-dGTP pyrophosphatase MutT (NUDIX family)|uniref:NUDIX hydrolase n=1 Tax=Lentibacter sp. XHP0401 TaxID=2984334 RepID=UPI0021E96D8B|nr:NUDIX hydrolase [Lentibacter sp. XHP0401]MCV2893513.1 NUDIX hydrolase [Lentibacter sp. XHP0401]
MNQPFKKAWEEILSPFLRRPKRLQVAALCYKPLENSDDKEILLVTSRDTGRWIIPKGWPIDGKNAPEAALQEAWEEAGVRKGKVTGKALGLYNYDKELKGGLPVAVETLVFPVQVTEMRDEYPEASQRTRKWVSPAEAANMVREPQLQDMLLAL